jgi:hypothetical protein
MPSLSITTSGDAPAKLRALSVAVQSRAGTSAGAASVRRAVQAHFLTLPTNQRGFPSSGFWAGAARSTVVKIDGEDTTVAATQVGVRRRFFGTGGSITPNQFGNSDAKYFAVPNQPETAGKYASDFPPDAFKFAFAQDENGQVHAALVPKGTALLSSRGENATKLYPLGTVMYWLYRTINQAPNPNVLPTEDELYAAYGQGLLSFIRARLHDPNAQIQIDEAL